MDLEAYPEAGGGELRAAHEGGGKVGARYHGLVIMRVRGEIFQVLVAGAGGGLLFLVLLLRLNPEIHEVPWHLMRAAVLWGLWGAAVLGLPLALVVRGIRRAGWLGHLSCFLPQVAAILFLLAAGLARVNADIHSAFLTGSAHRILGQDAVAWLATALVLLGVDRWLRRRGDRRRIGVAAAILLVLPGLRLLTEPTPPVEPAPSVARSLGRASRGLVVVGVEGLDLNLLLASASEGRYPTLSRLVSEGAWGALRPHRPFLRRSQWTSVAVGAYPRAHGVKSRWAWKIHGGFPEPVRLLPWTPVGSAWLLPRPVSRRVPPPPSLLPPLWERLAAGGMTAVALDWPGVWAPGTTTEPPAGDRSWGTLEVNLRHSLDLALAPFPEEGEALHHSLERDMANLAAARRARPSSDATVWLHLGALATARKFLEPLEVGDTDERAIQELVLEMLDEELEQLLLWRAEALIAVVSPYGYARPDSWERLRRLLGGGGRWRTSPRSCPDGVLVLVGQNVVPGTRFEEASLVDVAPTLCYLLGLPVAHSMEGNVIRGAVEPSYLARTPLRVVD